VNMGDAPSRKTLGAVVVVATLAFVGAGLTVRARRDRATWWARAERICSCGDATRRDLGRLAQDARDSGGLGAVAGAQRALLQADCDDLRVAVSRRSWSDEVARRPLRVIATDAHHQRAAAVTRSLATMCSGSNDELWQAVALDLAAHASDPPGDDAHRVRVTVGAHLRVRDAMCRDRARLSVTPRSYVLSALDADRQSSECHREVRAPRTTHRR